MYFIFITYFDIKIWTDISTCLSKMGLKRKRNERRKDVHPPNGYQSILNFEGFERKTSDVSPALAASPVSPSPQFCCEKCGLSHVHDGARKMHQRFCEGTKNEIPTSSLEITSKEEEVLPILDEIITNICKDS